MILLEPLSECFVLGAMASWAISYLSQIDPFAVYLFHILLWFLLDYTLLLIIQVCSLILVKTFGSAEHMFFFCLFAEIQFTIQQNWFRYCVAPPRTICIGTICSGVMGTGYPLACWYLQTEMGRNRWRGEIKVIATSQLVQLTTILTIIVSFCTKYTIS